MIKDKLLVFTNVTISIITIVVGFILVSRPSIDLLIASILLFILFNVFSGIYRYRQGDKSGILIFVLIVVLLIVLILHII